LEERLRWQELLVPLIAARLADEPGTANLRASAIVTSALACLDAASEAWDRLQRCNRSGRAVRRSRCCGAILILPCETLSGIFLFARVVLVEADDSMFGGAEPCGVQDFEGVDGLAGGTGNGAVPATAAANCV